MEGWIRNFAHRPGDSDEVAFSKTLILVVALSCCVCGVVWSALYWAVFGLGAVMALPLAFVVVVGGTVLVSARMADHRPLIYAQLACITWISTLIEWTIGSTAASGLVIVWSFLGPIGALVFLSFRQSLFWMGQFLVLVLISTAFHPALLGAPLSVTPRVQALFFSMNLGAASVVVFTAAAWFVRNMQRELVLRLEANRKLAESHRQLAASQQAILQSERMAALGRVSAGMAHELNNPAAAAQRGASQLRESVEGLERAARSLGGASLDEVGTARVRQLEAAAEERARSPLDLTPMERMDRESEIQEWLADHGLEDLDHHADVLVDLGLGAEEMEEVLGAVGGETLSAVLERTVWWYSTLGLIGAIGHGSNRISEIVRALKSYTYLDQAPIQDVDLNQGLNDTLLMLNSVLRQGVTVRRDLDDTLPRFTAHGSELNQVWTNLIGNAVDAMGGEGVLVVRTRRDGDVAVVQIIDSGAGIDAAVRDRIFDPFVTTKPVGAGTGLGLSISHNIVVQHHGGSLTVDSVPGRTCFEVRLPIVAGGS